MSSAPILPAARFDHSGLMHWSSTHTTEVQGTEGNSVSELDGPLPKRWPIRTRRTTPL